MSSRFERRSNNSSRAGRYSERKNEIGRSRRKGGRSDEPRQSSKERRFYKSSERSFEDNFSDLPPAEKYRLDSSLRENRDSYNSEQEGIIRNKGSRNFNNKNSSRRSSKDSSDLRYSRAKMNSGGDGYKSHRKIKTNDLEPSIQGNYLDSLDDDLIWGRHSSQATLESGRPIHRIWCTSEIRSSPKFLQLLREAKLSGVLVEEVSWGRLGQLTNGAVHQGIAIQIAAAETLDLKTLIEACQELDEHALLLAIDGLKDPQNLGAIVRSAEALGAHGLVLPQRRSAGLTGSVAKVAAGALEHLPVARVVNLNRSLETLKGEGYRIIGLAEEGDLTISEVDLDGPLVVVTGAEDKGISLITRRHCDHLVRIPLRGMTPSLNASVATAVLLYEVASRGWMKGISGQAPSPRMVRPKYSR